MIYNIALIKYHLLWLCTLTLPRNLTEATFLPGSKYGRKLKCRTMVNEND
eukprot:UN11727